MTDGLSAEPGRTVLVVDDDEMVRQALVRTLRFAGYRAHGLESPAAAFKVVGASRWDMVISDLLMPEMSGLEFLALVREHSPTTVRLLLSGNAEAPPDTGDLFFRCLPKPWGNDELCGVIQEAFATRGA